MKVPKNITRKKLHLPDLNQNHFLLHIFLLLLYPPTITMENSIQLIFFTSYLRILLYNAAYQSDNDLTKTRLL